MTLDEFKNKIKEITDDYRDCMYVIEAHESEEDCEDLYELAKCAVEDKFNLELEQLYNKMTQLITVTPTYPSNDWWNKGITTATLSGNDSVSVNYQDPLVMSEDWINKK